MKARVKATGVLIDVIPKANINAQHSGDNLYVCDNMIFRERDLDFLNIENSVINWEQRRYELAKTSMQGLLSNCSKECINMEVDQIAELSVMQADALVAELKKKGGSDEE